MPPTRSGYAHARGATSSDSASSSSLATRVVGVDETGLDVVSGNGDKGRIEARTKIWAAGVEASPLGRLLADRAGATVGRAGRVEVQPDCSLPDHPEVFVVGDLMALNGLGGLAEVAMQSGRHAARTIARRQRGRDPKPLRYIDLGTMATIARFRAVVSIGRLRIAGFLGWVMWLIVHLTFLTGFKNRLSALANWVVAFLGRGRRQRTITKQQVFARTHGSCIAQRKPGTAARSTREERRSMTNDTHADPAVQNEQRAQTQLAVGAMLVPIFFVTLFAACIIGTYHKPHPSNIRLGVVGPPALTAPLRAGLEKAGGSALDVRPVATVATAAHDVRQRNLNAAFVPTPNPKQPATIIVASANGRLVATAAETVARTVTTAQGAQLVVREVRPLPAGDEIGLGIFMFMIVCTICGYITPTILETVAPALAPQRRYPIMAVTAVLIPTIAYLIGGLAFGTYTGSVGTILAFIGVGALYTFVIGLGTRLFQVLLGPLGIFVSLAIFVFLNIATLGATYTSPVLGSFWRFLNHFWIGASTVNAERGILYFGGQGVGTDMLRLLAWTAVIVVLLILPASRKLERRREQPALAGGFRPPSARVASEA